MASLQQSKSTSSALSVRSFPCAPIRRPLAAIKTLWSLKHGKKIKLPIRPRKRKGHINTFAPLIDVLRYLSCGDFGECRPALAAPLPLLKKRRIRIHESQSGSRQRVTETNQIEGGALLKSYFRWRDIDE